MNDSVRSETGKDSGGASEDPEGEEFVFDNSAILRTFTTALSEYKKKPEEVEQQEMSWMNAPLDEGLETPPVKCRVQSQPQQHNLGTVFTAADFVDADVSGIDLSAVDEEPEGCNKPQEGTGAPPVFEPAAQTSMPHAQTATPPQLLGAEDDALAQLLLSWYYAGYNTGRYQAMREFGRQPE